MAKKPLIVNGLPGGWAVDKKVGIPGSVAFTQSVDFRKSPSQFTLLSRTTREDSGVVRDLVQNTIMDNSGAIYGLGSQGYFYKRTTAGVWSSIGNVSAGYFGLLYRQDQNAIYLAGGKAVSLYEPVSSSPSLKPDYYNISASTYDNTSVAGFNVDSNQMNGMETTAIGTLAVENPDNIRYFQSDIEPLNKISIFIVSKGTGDWTLTLHDGLNNILATSTVSNASLSNNTVVDFVFASPVRIQVSPSAQTYHLHVISTVADGTVVSTAKNNLSTCDLQIWADRLVVPNNGMHPMTTFQQFVCIGNEHYLSVWEPLGDPSPSNSEWQRHKLTFPPGYEVCGLAVFNEYLAIACERTTTGTSTPQDGIIFFWDGLSSTYNYFTLVPEGSPYAIHQNKNILFYEAGGAWYAMVSVTAQPEKIRTLPFGENAYNNNNTTTKVYPYAATVRNGVQLMAWPSVSTNTNIQFGVYSWGQVDKNLPNSFGYSYVISTGAQTYSGSNNLTIGMVQNFGDTLLISWRDDLNGGYGVDMVNSSSKPAAFGSVESLVYDLGYVGKEKEADYIEATWLPLPDGAEIVLKYSINRGAWVESPRYSNTVTWQDGDGYARLNTFNSDSKGGRFNELQMGMDVYTTDAITSSPVVTSISTVVDTLNQEVLQ